MRHSVMMNKREIWERALLEQICMNLAINWLCFWLSKSRMCTFIIHGFHVNNTSMKWCNITQETRERCGRICWVYSETYPFWSASLKSKLASNPSWLLHQYCQIPTLISPVRKCIQLLHCKVSSRDWHQHVCNNMNLVCVIQYTL